MTGLIFYANLKSYSYEEKSVLLRIKYIYYVYYWLYGFKVLKIVFLGALSGLYGFSRLVIYSMFILLFESKQSRGVGAT